MEKAENEINENISKRLAIDYSTFNKELTDYFENYLSSNHFEDRNDKAGLIYPDQFNKDIKIKQLA